MRTAVEVINDVLRRQDPGGTGNVVCAFEVERALIEAGFLGINDKPPARALAAERERIAEMLTVEARETERSELRQGFDGRGSGAIHYAAQLVREGATAESLVS